VLDKALRRRVAVNTIEGDTLFTGRLAEYDGTTFVLEQCETVPNPGETANPIAGRQYVDRIHGFLTELPT
jgi:small nuclear ribonucleoprotein (snRNP)-like protein